MVAELFVELSSGYKIPAVGLGTSKANEDDLEKAIDAALTIGYRHIDTAHVYQNDRPISRVLKKWLDSGKLKREDLFITSKLPFINLTIDKIEEIVTGTLKSLGLDYLDLYLIHFPINVAMKSKSFAEAKFEALDTDHLAIWRELEKLVDAGKIRSLGVSNFNKSQIDRIVKSNPKHKISIVQVELHVYMQQRDLLEYSRENKIAVTAYAPLGSPGYNKHLIEHGLPAKKNLPDILNDDTIRKISLRHGKSPAQIVLRFLRQSNVIVIPKSVTENRLRENFEVYDFELSDEDVKELRMLDLGEDGRIFTYEEYKGFSDHPEWPFPK